MTPNKEAYIAALREILDRYNALEAETLLGIHAALDDLMKAVKVELLIADNFQVIHLQRVIKSLETSIQFYDQQLRTTFIPAGEAIPEEKSMVADVESTISSLFRE